jgi:outer membrane biosynthesis protein TonB
MRYLLTIICLIIMQTTFAQGGIAEAKFHEGSGLFISGNPQAALASVNQGLKAEPANQKLQALKKLLEDEKKKQDQQKKEEQKKQQQKEQEQKKNQDKQGEKKEQEKDKEKQGEQKEPKDKEEQKDPEKKDQDEKDAQKEKQDIPDDVKKKLEEMKIDPEKAKMILEAMRNQEVQYLQQQQRESTKPRERNKPDW